MPMQCPACGYLNPVGRAKCLKCGSLLHPQSGNVVTASCILTMLPFVFCLLFLIRGCPSDSPKYQAEQRTRDAVIASHRIVETYLKCPSTAKFPNSYDVPVTINNDGTFLVISYVDAENDFGAPIRTPYCCELRYVGPGRWDFEAVYLQMGNTTPIPR